MGKELSIVFSWFIENIIYWIPTVSLYLCSIYTLIRKGERETLFNIVKHVDPTRGNTEVLCKHYKDKNLVWRSEKQISRTWLGLQRQKWGKHPRAKEWRMS